ncbi:hypothetical protein JJD41_02085 [Oxynema sp. CENA135]|uniref:hypothetical protein n=1 Tax=Oxynema sp. CENA135 TaxID=984206 RepID=UPI00190E545B|nr:hypothetical protein [Oxynema sp. CENA135]MBK4728679.1 hypothetical protein [Oxynema sp. CENA135]
MKTLAVRVAIEFNVDRLVTLARKIVKGISTEIRPIPLMLTTIATAIYRSDKNF